MANVYIHAYFHINGTNRTKAKDIGSVTIHVGEKSSTVEKSACT